MCVQGLHYIGEKSSFMRYLGPAGLSKDAVEFIPMDTGGFDVLRFPGIEFRVPASIEAYQHRLEQMFPAESNGIRR